MLGHSKRLVALAQSLTPHLTEAQFGDTASGGFGDIIMEPKGFSEPCALVIPIVNFIGMYYHPESRYQKNEELLRRAEGLMKIMLESMHEDGTMDLLETNFHDATATAFLVAPLAGAYRLIEKEGGGTKMVEKLSALMMDFFEKGAEGMKNGGFHTPNHRWVMAAALSLVYNILDNPAYKKEALKYLNEGIDCDEEGEYTERSAAIYDIAVNESLITVAEELDMPYLLDYVERNLTKNFAYLEPDRTMCTINSKRQDFSTRYFPLRHYWTAAYMAHKRKSPFFAYLAEELLKLMESMAQTLPGYLFTGGKEDVHNPVVQYLLHGYLEEPLQTEAPEWGGEWFFPQNGVLRRREGKASLTLVRDREVFLKYQSGKNTLHMKIGSCFFGRGYFKPQTIEKIKGGYRLHSLLVAGYVRPLSEKPESGVWDELPHESRKKVHMQEQKITVDVLTGKSVKIKVDVGGPKGVPVKIEMILVEGGRLNADGFVLKGEAGGHAILKKGCARYTLRHDTIKIEGGSFAHWYTSGMRGTAEASKDAFTLYMTGFTPFEHEITLSPEGGTF